MRFKSKWREFLERSISCRCTPLFWQLSRERVQTPAEDLTYEEENALRYTVGYVCPSIRRKLESANSLRYIAIVDMCGDSSSSEDEHKSASSRDRITSVDRGGLCHVKDTTYMVFVAMEENLRHHFKISNVREMTDDFRKKVVKELLENEDIGFYRSMLALSLEPKGEAVLLKMLVEHGVTVRGFSFAYVEVYKQHVKKNQQKSKGL